ncbi:MAG: hypothetical protein IJP90_05010 [Treponema sp.]|nr:hypothetical protein [Treponema sp.]MBR0099056.1 hypothetical protein [Treponema sp.]
MKKFMLALFSIALLCTSLFAGDFKNPETDAEIKHYLVSNGFGYFTFSDDGRWSFSEKVIGDTVVAEGKYSVSDGLIFFETCDTEEKPLYNGEYWDKMQVPGKYKLDLEKIGLHFKGALINVQNGRISWSDEWAPPYVKFDYEGTECIRYPWRNEGVENEYILILDNLKLRKAPSLSSELVSVGGVEEEGAGFYYGERSIALAGQTCTIRAKTVKKDTIDGITAPWYLIVAYGVDEMGLDTAEAFVFGGYVKEIKASELEKTDRENKEKLKKSILRIGGTLYH